MDYEKLVEGEKKVTLKGNKDTLTIKISPTKTVNKKQKTIWFRAWLKYRMKELDMSQAELGRRLDVSRERARQYLSDYWDLKDETMKKITDELEY